MAYPGSLSRREFLAGTTAVLAVGALAPTSGEIAPAPGAAPGQPRQWPVIGFSKPFQHLNPAQTAAFVAEVGWDGIECPVRAKGQVEPARVADDLPAYVDALRRNGHDIHVVTTDLTSLATPHAEAVLRTMAHLGLKRLRLGFMKYEAGRRPQDQLAEIAPRLRDLATACADLGLQIGCQNHSGADYVGAPVWDVFGMIRELDPRHIGFCFDIGHATIEGGLSWPLEARLAEPFYTAVFVKDFVWRKNGARWNAEWCPLGEGMVNPDFFATLKRSAFAGPISQHHEYPIGNDAELRTHCQRDLATLRRWLA